MSIKQSVGDVHITFNRVCDNCGDSSGESMPLHGEYGDGKHYSYLCMDCFELLGLKFGQIEGGAINMGVGMPAEIKLHEFGSHVWAAFGEMPYHVGSSLKSKQWRDVDVRLILSDEAWDAYGFSDPARILSDGRWVALCLAFSALGKEMTGLPIDFQIQKMSDANDRYDELRSAIGRVPLRYDANSRK